MKWIIFGILTLLWLAYTFWNKDGEKSFFGYGTGLQQSFLNLIGIIVYLIFIIIWLLIFKK